MSFRIKNLSWIFLDKFGLIALSLLTFLAFAYYLTPEELGVGVFIIAIYELIGVFCNRMLEDPLLRQERITAGNISTIIIFGLCMSFSIVSVFTFTAYVVTSDLNYTSLVLVAGLKIFFTIFSRPFIAQLRKKRNFKHLALRTLLGKLVGAVCAIIVASQGGGTLAVVLQSVIMEFVSLLSLVTVTKNWFSTSISFSFYVGVVREGLPAAIKTSCSSVYERGVIILLGLFATKEIVGFLSFGKRLIELPLSSITSGLTGYAVPAMASRAKNKDQQTFFFVNITSVLILLFVPFFLILGLVGGDFITLVFGHKWVGAIPFFQLFAFIAMLRVTTIFIPGFLVVNSLSKLGMKFEVVNSLLGLALIYASSQILDSYHSIFYLIPFTTILLSLSRFLSAGTVDKRIIGLIVSENWSFIFITSISAILLYITKSIFQLSIVEFILVIAISYTGIYLFSLLFCRNNVLRLFNLIKG